MMSFAKQLSLIHRVCSLRTMPNIAAASPSVRLTHSSGAQQNAAPPPPPPDNEDITLPDPPDNCCMSNCANCVWIVYAQELERMFHDGGATAKKLILQKMQDPSMRAFLSMELTLATKKVPPADDKK